jgi:hypothetical protein
LVQLQKLCPKIFFGFFFFFFFEKIFEKVTRRLMEGEIVDVKVVENQMLKWVIGFE